MQVNPDKASPQRFADCIVIADGVMNICDYKHDKGVEVSAVANPQMMLYALGVLEIFDDIYDIDTVRMTIFQPLLPWIWNWCGRLFKWTADPAPN